MQSKVNWDEAPEWAQYWAMDSDGEAFWYEKSPMIDEPDGVWTPFIDTLGWRLTEYASEFAPTYGVSPENWKQSLSARWAWERDRKTLYGKDVWSAWRNGKTVQRKVYNAFKESKEDPEFFWEDSDPNEFWVLGPDMEPDNWRVKPHSETEDTQDVEPDRPYALELAEKLEGKTGNNCYCEALASIECACPDVDWPENFTQEAANELCRLQEENEDLRDALSKYATDEEPWGWDAIDALSSAGTDEYVEDKVMSDKIIFAEESMTTKVTRKDGKIKVRAGSGYAPGVDKLCTVKDTGNGFIVKFHSHSCTTQPDYHSIDYSHAAYLLMALLVEHNVGDTFGKIDIVDQDQSKDGGLDDLKNA